MKSAALAVQIEQRIFLIRGQRVMLDRDLARVYGVTTKAFNQAVKRNQARFPEEFMFQLSNKEAKTILDPRSQNVTLKRGQNINYCPYVFTEHGALQAANILILNPPPSPPLSPRPKIGFQHK